MTASRSGQPGDSGVEDTAAAVALAAALAADLHGTDLATAAAPNTADWASLDFNAAARFVDNEARARQEAAWALTNVNARQICGARDAQRLHAHRLRTAVLNLFRVRTLLAGLSQAASALGQLLPNLLMLVLEFEEPSRGALLDMVGKHRQVEATAPVASGCAPPGLEVCARKRPLLGFELEHGEWDCIEAMPRSGSIFCHDGRLSRSGRKLLMTHHYFGMDRVWGPAASTEVVYQDVVRPRLQLALQGGGATLLCTGQTGTGKTFTVCGVAECLARDLQAGGHDVSISFFEIYGKKCCDLLADRKEVFLRSDEKDQVHVSGRKEIELPHGKGLGQVVGDAMRLRASEETERNTASSRSHAICALRLGGHGGMLRLVDLAGSERNFETTKMTAAQHRESAEINRSLMVLKDCFRAHAALQRGEQTRLPFRGSRLTRVLQDCFVDPTHSTAVIATISPSATDVIHTVNTLRHAALLSTSLSDLASNVTIELPLHLKGTGSFKDTAVMEWSASDVLAWLQEAEGGRFAHVVVPPDLTGARLLRTSAQGLSELFEQTLRRARVDGEGEAWNIGVDNVGANLGREIFAAARLAAVPQ